MNKDFTYLSPHSDGDALKILKRITKDFPWLYAIRSHLAPGYQIFRIIRLPSSGQGYHDFLSFLASPNDGMKEVWINYGNPPTIEKVATTGKCLAMQICSMTSGCPVNFIVAISRQTGDEVITIYKPPKELPDFTAVFQQAVLLNQTKI